MLVPYCETPTFVPVYTTGDGIVILSVINSEEIYCLLVYPLVNEKISKDPHSAFRNTAVYTVNESRNYLLLEARYWISVDTSIPSKEKLTSLLSRRGGKFFFPPAASGLRAVVWFADLASCRPGACYSVRRSFIDNGHLTLVLNSSAENKRSETSFWWRRVIWAASTKTADGSLLQCELR
jgi:hypothetical protein